MKWDVFEYIIPQFLEFGYDAWKGSTFSSKYRVLNFASTGK